MTHASLNSKSVLHLRTVALKNGPVRDGIIDHLLFYPAAHWRLLDRELQLTLLKLYHRSNVAKVGHGIGFPITTLGWFTLAHQYTIALSDGSTVNGAHALGIALLIYSTYIDLFSALAIFSIGNFLLTPNFFADIEANSPLSPTLTGLALIMAGSVIQALSHSPEAVPPPKSGSHAFIPYRQWWPTATTRQRISYLSAGPIGVALESWAGIRLLPFLVMWGLQQIFLHQGQLDRLSDEWARALENDINAPRPQKR